MTAARATVKALTPITRAMISHSDGALSSTSRLTCWNKLKSAVAVLLVGVRGEACGGSRCC